MILTKLSPFLGVVLAAERKEHSSLFVPTRESGKLYRMYEHIMVAVSGVVADANFLIQQGRTRCLQSMYQTCENIGVEQCVRYLAERKHVSTLYGGGRPFGVSFMYAGYDPYQGFQLYCSDPSGNYAAWKAQATGKNSTNAKSTLKDEYREDMTLNEGLLLATKVLGKSMDMAKPSADRFEIGLITKDAAGNLVQRTMEGEELAKILDDAKVWDEIAAAKK